MATWMAPQQSATSWWMGVIHALGDIWLGQRYWRRLAQRLTTEMARQSNTWEACRAGTQTIGLTAPPGNGRSCGRCLVCQRNALVARLRVVAPVVTTARAIARLGSGPHTPQCVYATDAHGGRWSCAELCPVSELQARVSVLPRSDAPEVWTD